jgi:hypothetical protein
MASTLFFFIHFAYRSTWNFLNEISSNFNNVESETGNNWRTIAEQNHQMRELGKLTLMIRTFFFISGGN